MTNDLLRPNEGKKGSYTILAEKIPEKEQNIVKVVERITRRIVIWEILQKIDGLTAEEIKALLKNELNAKKQSP